MSSEMEKDFFKLMNNSIFSKTKDGRDFFKLMNNSVHGKTIKEKINTIHPCKELPFYNTFIEKSKITSLKNKVKTSS